MISFLPNPISFLPLSERGIVKKFSEEAAPSSLEELWDDDEDNDGKVDKGKIEAPSISDVTKIVAVVGAAAIGIVAGIVTAGAATAAVMAGVSSALVASAAGSALLGAAAVGAALTFSVNATDTIATGAYYGKPAQEIALSVAKDAAISSVGILTAGIGSGVGAGTTVLANMAIQAGVGAGNGLLTTGVSAVAGALNFQNGNLQFDTSKEYWNNQGASMLMGVATGAFSGAVGGIGSMKDGKLSTLFQTGNSGLNKSLDGLLKAGLNTVGRYAIENGVGALKQHWDTGSFNGYVGTEFNWGSAMGSLSAGVMSGVETGGGRFVDNVLKYGVEKIGTFAGNAFNYAVRGRSFEEYQRQKGIDMIGGLSFSVDSEQMANGFSTALIGMRINGSGVSVGNGVDWKGGLSVTANEMNSVVQRAIAAATRPASSQGGIPEKPQGVAGNAVLGRGRQGEVVGDEEYQAALKELDDEFERTEGKKFHLASSDEAIAKQFAEARQVAFEKFVAAKNWALEKLSGQNEWDKNQRNNQTQQDGAPIADAMCGPESFAGALMKMGFQFPKNVDPADYIHGMLEGDADIQAAKTEFNKDNKTSYSARNLQGSYLILAERFGLKSSIEYGDFSKSIKNGDDLKGFFNQFSQPNGSVQYMLGVGTTASGHQTVLDGFNSKGLRYSDPYGIPDFTKPNAGGYPTYRPNSTAIGSQGIGGGVSVSWEDAFKNKFGGYVLKIWKPPR